MLDKHKQDLLVQTLLGQEYGAHNVFKDVKGLKKPGGTHSNARYLPACAFIQEFLHI